MPSKKSDALPRISWRIARRASVAALALNCLIAVPATAQLTPEPPLGSRLPKPLDQFPIDETRPILATFGKCIVRRNPALAREFILSNRNYSLDERFRPLILPECLGESLQGTTFGDVQLSLTSPVLWYIIADALVGSDLQRFNPDVLRAGPSLPELTIDPAKMRNEKGRPAAPSEVAKNLAIAKNDLALVKYGECVVRADPHGSQGLLATRINSKEEGAALTALLPAFSACLDKGQQLGASRLILRGIIAFNYYRLAYAPKVTNPAKS